MDAITTDLAAGLVTPATFILLVVVSAICAVIGGIAGATVLAGKDLGADVTRMLGMLLGPPGVLPGVILALVLSMAL